MSAVNVSLSHLRFDLPLRRLEGEKVIGFVQHFSLTPLALWGRGELNRPCVCTLLFRGDVRSHILVGSYASILLVRRRSHDNSNAWGLCMILLEGRQNVPVSLAGTDRTLPSDVGRAHGMTIPLRPVSWHTEIFHKLSCSSKAPEF